MILNKIKIIIIGISNIFNFAPAEKEEMNIIEYETEYVYSEKYAEGEEFIITEGEYGYSYFNGEEEIIKEPINQVLKVGTHKNSDYNGTLTGYGPDCVGCSKQGYVACRTSDKKNWSLINDGILYHDVDYGDINIVAADTTLFPCGTIIEINNSKYNHILAVVLDTGFSMRKAWRINKKVHLDLAFESEKGTNAVTNKNTNYHVKRWGW